MGGTIRLRVGHILVVPRLHCLRCGLSKALQSSHTHQKQERKSPLQRCCGPRDAHGNAPGGAGAQLQEVNGNFESSLLFLDKWSMRCTLTEQPAPCLHHTGSWKSLIPKGHLLCLQLLELTKCFPAITGVRLVSCVAVTNEDKCGHLIKQEVIIPDLDAGSLGLGSALFTPKALAENLLCASWSTPSW